MAADVGVVFNNGLLTHFTVPINFGRSADQRISTYRGRSKNLGVTADFWLTVKVGFSVDFSVIIKKGIFHLSISI